MPARLRLLRLIASLPEFLERIGVFPFGAVHSGVVGSSPQPISKESPSVRTISISALVSTTFDPAGAASGRGHDAGSVSDPNHHESATMLSIPPAIDTYALATTYVRYSALMSVTATQLRQDIFKLLDQVLETGEPLEIRRGGRILRVVPDEPVSKLARLKSRADIMVGDPEELVEIDVHEWHPERVLEP